ncbi:LysR family transcriptional regulator [Thalassotalea sp. PLHSN55]|uniref:LysR family transcriptional regulator n=1 Tax=Thalassotalea sp. PLHSN55 TaxID=3435888 RepID=UPI003F829D30
MITAKNIQQLDFNLLKVFECLYLERNMSLAAKVLFISPSAVSHAIKRLRLVLGDELFVRQGQLMQPTPACQRMAPQLLDTLEKLRQILQTCGDFNLAETTQTFKFAIHDALEPIVIPKIHKLLAAQAPYAKAVSGKIVREDMSRQLATNVIDVAIDVALPLKKPINHFKLSSDHFCILMSSQNALADHLDKTSYLRAQHIAVSNRTTGIVVEDLALLQQGINREVSIRCQGYQAAKEVVKNSDLLLTLPSLIAEQLRDDGLVVVPLPFNLPKIATHLYWHQNTEQDDALIWFREALKQMF